MGRLVQRVQGQPAPGLGDGSLPLAQSTAAAREPLQGDSQLPAQTLRLEKLPVVEGDAVTQAEACHEIVAVQRRGLG